MLSHLVTVCLALLPFAQCMQIHKHMTPEEVLKTFQTEHYNVPEYEIVRLYHTLHKRDINKNSAQIMKFKALGRALSLYLEPTEGLLAGVSTPVWTVVEDAGEPEGLKYTQQPNVLANIGQAYQDVSTMSAIVAYKGEDGETLVHGNVLEDLIIRPLPHRLHNTILRETRDLVDLLPDGVDGEVDFQRSHHHVVFKKSKRDMNANHNGIRVVERERRSFESSANNRSKRSIPDIVYPEVLIIVDHSLYKLIGKNVEEATRYILAYWNGVDLRYRLVKEPVIRLNIAGIIMSPQPLGTPYLENAKLHSTLMIPERALNALGLYVYKARWRYPFANYDFAVAMTHYDLCSDNGNRTCDRSTLGTAIIKGACSKDYLGRTTGAVGIVEDNGGYIGLIPTAHEVAHLMGVPHDESPGSIDCPDRDEHLMAPSISYHESTFQLSNCSLKHLYDFLSSRESMCLRNKPWAGKALPRILPGQVLTLDEQCEKLNGTKACYHDARVCTHLKCVAPGNDTLCVTSAAAAEGSSCGNESHCINGYCVSKKMAHVPYIPSGRRREDPYRKCQGSYLPVLCRLYVSFTLKQTP